MKCSICPNCKNPGISGWSRLRSGRLFPIRCAYCETRFYVRLPLRVTLLLSSLVAIIWGVLLVFTLTNAWMFTTGVLGILLLIVSVNTAFGKLMPVPHKEVDRA